jgi:hypothetical protein
MVRDLVQELVFLSDGPDGPRVRRVGEDCRRRLDLVPRKDPVEEERS